MSLLKTTSEGWQGILTGRMYYPPRENKQSAEAQERKYAQTLPLRTPKDVKPGSAEEAKYKFQEEALSNVQRADVKETSLAYREFIARHPEYVNNDRNSDQLCEYFHMKGVQFVDFNGAYVPLATSTEQWEEAYQWKLAMGSVQVDTSVMDAQERLKAQKKAEQHFKNLDSAATEDELYAMPKEAFEKLARGGL